MTPQPPVKSAPMMRAGKSWVILELTWVGRLSTKNPVKLYLTFSPPCRILLCDCSMR